MVKVGDKVRILVDGADCADVKMGDEFVVKSVESDEGATIEGGCGYSFSPENFEVISRSITPHKDPIKYLESAHAKGDMIDPVTMLRECYGIIKTERVSVEWPDAKPNIKVGDKVRVVGDSLNDWEDLCKIGGVYPVKEIDDIGYRLILDDGRDFWFHAFSVEPV